MNKPKRVAFAKIGTAFFTMKQFNELVKVNGEPVGVDWEEADDSGVAYFIEIIEI